MAQTIQPVSPAFAEGEGSAIFAFSRPETTVEQEKTNFVQTLDDLCAALKKYSTALVKNKSEIISFRSRVDKLRINKENKI